MRLGIGFSLLLVTVLVAFGSTLWMSADGRERADAAHREAAGRSESVAALQAAQLEAVSSVRNVALLGNARLVKAEMATDAQAIRQLHEEEATLAARPLDKVSAEHLQQAVALRQSAELIAAEAVEHVLALSSEEGARVLSVKFTPIQATWQAQLRLLAAHERQLANAELNAIEQDNRHRMAILVAALVGVVAVAAAGAACFARSVTRQLQHALEVSRKVADGDLATEVDARGHDETAALLQSLAWVSDRLSTMVRSVRQAACSVGESSRNIGERNKDLWVRTERQAAALEQTSAALSELAATLSDSTNSAGEQGRSRAVVPAEVRSLSQRMKEEAGEVRRLIAESIERVSAGSREASRMGATLEALVSSAARVETFLDSIAQPPASQRPSLCELDAAMQDVDAAMQKNAALVEHVASIAGHLVDQTEALNAQVGRFNLPRSA